MIKVIEKLDIPANVCAANKKYSTATRSLVYTAAVAISVIALSGCEDDKYEPDNSKPVPVPGKVIVDENSIDQYIEDQEPEAERRDGVGLDEELHDLDSVRETRLQLEHDGRFNELQSSFIQLDEMLNTTDAEADLKHA